MAKKKRKKLSLKRIIILVLVLYIIGYLIYYLFSEPIRNIIIEGNFYVTDGEIIKSAELDSYPPIFSFRESKINKKIKENIPLVENIKIHRNLKFQLTIKVEEKKIICIYNDILYLSDASIIDNNKMYLGIPTLVNYVPDNILKEFLNKMGELSYDTLSLISEIEYSPTSDNDGTFIDETRFIFRMNDGNIIYINTARLSAMKKYQKIYASLNDRKGILHLDSGDYMEVK